MNNDEFDKNKLLEVVKEMAEESKQNKYHCKIKTIEVLANSMDNDIIKLLECCDKCNYIPAQIITQYLYAHVKALEIVINELKDGTETMIK